MSDSIEFASPEEVLPPDLLSIAKGLEPLPEIKPNRYSAHPRETVPCGINFKPVTAHQLLSVRAPERVWIWENYIPEGGLVLLCGAPKAGKSTLAYHLTKAVAAGETFLGYKTKKSAVLILAMEEHVVDVQLRVESLSIIPDNLFIHSGPLKAKPVELQAIADCIKREKIGLLIVDTLARFWTIKDENNATDAGASMTPILDLARNSGVAILLLHHLRKSPGADGDDIRGSGDVFAIVDAALTFRRRGEAKTQRVLQAFSRYSPPAELIINLENGEYSALGDVQHVKHREQKAKVFEVLTMQPRDAEAIASALDMPLGTARTVLSQLAESGEIGRDGEGKRNKPYLYFSMIDSAQL